MPPKRKKMPKFGRASPVEQICKKCRAAYVVSIVMGTKTKSCKCKKTMELSTDHVKENLKCNQCPKMFKFHKSYLKHLKDEHSKKPGSVLCDHCNVSCPNKSVLKKHIAKTHNRKEFNCPHCHKIFARHSHVLRHLSQSGCNGNEVSVFPCEICDAKFTRKDNLIVHLRYQHILSPAFECKYCPYGNKNFSKLVKHWQENHLEPRRYECDICGKTTSSRTSIAKHLEIHGEKKYICTQCGYRTFTAEVLKRHTLTHVSNKPHKCEICGASYIQRAQLVHHLRKHIGFICNTCNKSFNSKAKLFIHTRTHLGLERLVCPFEDCIHSKKEFSTAESLEKHVSLHLQTKEYQCEVCNKRYDSEGNMRRHLSTHRLDRPRRCMYCVTARAFSRGEQLVRHVRKHHADLFAAHLKHVRQVLGTSVAVERVKKSELQSILVLLDAEFDRIMEGFGTDVLYGGVQPEEPVTNTPTKTEDSPLMSEEELEENLRKLLAKLIDEETLECFGWPEENVDTVLEKVVLQMGGRVADRNRWSRVQRLRENTKHLFLYAVDDKDVPRMLDTHTIDQIVRHVLMQVAD